VQTYIKDHKCAVKADLYAVWADRNTIDP